MSYPTPLLQKTDAQTFETFLEAQNPVLAWLSPSGESPTTDVYKSLEAVAAKYPQMKVLIVDIQDSPALKTRFEVGSKAVLVGVYQDEVQLRRARPWAVDVQSAAESLITVIPQEKNEEASRKEEKALNNTPVHITDTSFEKEVLESELPVLVDFWAEWCPPCRAIAPILDKLAKEYAGKVKIAKVDVDHNQGLSQAFQIQSIPTLMCVKEGKIVFSQPGALPEPALRDLLDQLVALKMPA